MRNMQVSIIIEKAALITITILFLDLIALKIMRNITKPIRIKRISTFQRKGGQGKQANKNGKMPTNTKMNIHCLIFIITI